jgi:integrase/recombinase XerD
MKKVLVKVVPDVRRLKNDNNTPLALRITFKGERKYYCTGYNNIVSDCEKINAMAVIRKTERIKERNLCLRNEYRKDC